MPERIHTVAASTWPMHRHDASRSSNLSGLQHFFPFADAGTDQTVDENTLIQLDATGSFDQNGNALSYQWVQIEGPVVSLSDGTAAQPSFTAPNVGLSGATLVFKLLATNDNDWISTDTVSVTVNDTFVSTESYKFGSVTVAESSDAFIIDIYNSRDYAVTISEIVLSDDINFSVDRNVGNNPLSNLPRILYAGETATFGVRFVPTAPGIYDANVTFTSSDPDHATTPIPLNGWGKVDPAAESFVVTLGEKMIFSSCNLSGKSGTAESDGQNATATASAGPHEQLTSQAFGGVRFDVIEGPGGISVSDATISITMDYRLKVDFDVLPPAQNGGGSADVWLYAWIHNLKEDVAHIAFIHTADRDEQDGTITFTHRLGDAPTWTHLYAGQTYEVKAELYTHADVNIGHEADTFGSFTVKEVKIDFVPPERPQILLPADGTAALSLTPVLQTENFNHLISAVSHIKTKWQIAADPDFNLILLDLESDVDLTSFQVPELVLYGDTTCYWRVKFVDSWHIQSVWSDTASFTTLKPPNDTNPPNGVPDDQEVGSGTDLDRNGQDDHTQGNIKCVNAVMGNMQIGLKGPNADLQIESLIWSQLNDITDPVNRPNEMPMGLIGFRLLITNPNPSGVYEVIVYMSQAIPAGAIWYRYDPISGWQDYSAHTTIAADRMSVTITLQDGGFGDLDRIRNNIIIDPSGFAINSSSAPAQSVNSGGEGGGCFILGTQL